MEIFNRIHKEESGYILVFALIFLVLGSLTIVPLLKFTFTELDKTVIDTQNLFDLYTCDAASEEGIQKLIKMPAPLDTLEVNESYTYTTDTINDRTATVTLTKLSLIEGIIGDDEYKVDRPHEDWISMDIPSENITRNYTENWVEYVCQLNFDYQGGGNRNIDTIGFFLAPYPGDIETGPYDEVLVPLITWDDFDRIDEKVIAGGFSYIYRWQKNKGPSFIGGDTGSISIKFKVDDADWTLDTYFAWATVKEQDVSFVASHEMSKWHIEAVVEDNTIIVEAIEESGNVDLLSWELFKN